MKHEYLMKTLPIAAQALPTVYNYNNTNNYK